MITLKPRSYKPKAQRGFIALMSAIIISIILLLIATNLSLTGFYGRANVMDSELKKRSLALAEACVDTAILKLTNDAGYSPNNECVSVEDGCPDGLRVCTILGVENNVPSAGKKTIRIQAKPNNYFTNLEVVINSDMSIFSWEEVADGP